MVSIIITAATPRMARPAVVSLPAFSANCCMYTVMTRPDAAGIRFSRMKLRMAPANPANTGKAENTVSVTVSSGTNASSVVNVRLPETWASRSSRTRANRWMANSKVARIWRRMGRASWKGTSL